MKRLIGLSLALAAFVLLPSGVSAETPEMTEAFVCPVLNETVGDHNPNVSEIGEGDYSFGPGESNGLYIPVTATNADGEGTPGGNHSAPGENDYTAIWAVQE